MEKKMKFKFWSEIRREKSFRVCRKVKNSQSSGKKKMELCFVKGLGKQVSQNWTTLLQMTSVS